MKKIIPLFASEEETVLRATEAYVCKLMESDASGHDFRHVERVRSMARHLASFEQSDRFIIEMAVLLHDIDDPKRTGSEDSHLVETFLCQFDPILVPAPRILEIITNLSFSSQMKGRSETSIEGKVVQDADRLDALGAIGIARAFAYGGAKGRPMFTGSHDDDSSIAHFHQKLFKLVSLMNTKSGKKIAVQRTAYMQKYVDEFDREWKFPKGGSKK